MSEILPVWYGGSYWKHWKTETEPKPQFFVKYRPKPNRVCAHGNRHNSSMHARCGTLVWLFYSPTHSNQSRNVPFRWSSLALTTRVRWLLPASTHCETEERNWQRDSLRDRSSPWPSWFRQSFHYGHKWNLVSACHSRSTALLSGGSLKRLMFCNLTVVSPSASGRTVNMLQLISLSCLNRPCRAALSPSPMGDGNSKDDPDCLVCKLPISWASH